MENAKAIESIKKHRGLENTSSVLKLAIETAANNPEAFKKFLESVFSPYQYNLITRRINMKLYQAKAFEELGTFIQKMKDSGTEAINLQELQNVMSRLSSKAFSTITTKQIMEHINAPIDYPVLEINLSLDTKIAIGTDFKLNDLEIWQFTKIYSVEVVETNGVSHFVVGGRAKRIYQ